MASALRLKLYLAIAEYTSIPLLLGMYLMIVSGYGMVRQPIVSAATLGVMDYYRSTYIHVLSKLKYVVALLTFAHAVSGLELLIHRKVRNNFARRVLEALAIVLAGIIPAAQITMFEVP